jgi:C-8 sterol isomerase
MHYVFDPEIIDECSLLGIGHPKPEMFDIIAQAIEERYPGYIYHDQPWLYSIAGGAMIQMKLYFASLYEYIMIWGTPIGSEGHSGRHHVAFWDTVIDGETWYYAEGQFEKRVYRPGDRIYVGKRQACGMNFTDGVWAVEYARGPIYRSIPFGLADELLSARDFLAAKQTIAIYATLIGRHWTARYNRDYPLMLPIKKMAGVVMKSVGSRVTRRLVPPPPREINHRRSASVGSPERTL